MPPASMAMTAPKGKPKKIVFGDDGEVVSKMPPVSMAKTAPKGKPKKIVFGDDGNTVLKPPPATMAKTAPKGKPKKIVFGDDGEVVSKMSPVSMAKTVLKPPPATMAKTAPKGKPKKIVFGDDGEVVSKMSPVSMANTVLKPPPATMAKTAPKGKPKKIVFGDDGDVQSVTVGDDSLKMEDGGMDAEEDYFTRRERTQQRKKKERNGDDDAQTKWYHVFPSTTCENSDDVLDMKEKEQMELFNLCKNSYESEKSSFYKRNPSDARWLLTALHKGTAKDRANAGALLVTSNPLGNLDALLTLIGYTKLSNKASTDVIGVLTDLWQEVLLPPHRKLVSIKMRGTDWKMVRNDSGISKERQHRVYAYWYFENELKEAYFEFLKNLQQSLQNGQETDKNSGIIAASKLLIYAPEKEQMILTMIVNKLGDPLPKVASKALHYLTEVAFKHPNMCGVIVVEAEKLLFRNNISDRAQHFALCFLASVATSATAQVCTKLVNICFSFFKVLVQKGAVNNRTMQAILRCLQQAIVEAEPTKGNAEILSKDMQDTIYRLVHLADARISIQTLGLLLQMVTVKSEKSDRFYNALYKKMLDMELTNIGTKTAAQLLHIIHRAIHVDWNVPRAKAFIKRLLQMALNMPTHIAAGCLIVLYKLLRSRRELVSESEGTTELLKLFGNTKELPKDEIDVTENQNTVEVEKELDYESTAVNPSNENSMEVNSEKLSNKKERNKYDPFHRVPSFAGAEFAQRNEFVLLCQHIHPTVKLFAENILNHKRISYYGDPLRDFGLPHFLERFAFKNPKKLDNEKAETPGTGHRRYIPSGSRGQSVKSLTKENCPEDELFIFNYLEHKRQQAALVKDKKSNDAKDVDEEDNLKPTDIDDDEFDEYLDGFFGKKSKHAGEQGSEDELDFLKELGGEFKDDEKSKKTKKKRPKDDNVVDDIDADWGDDGDDDDDDEEADDEDVHFEGDENISDNEDESIDLSEADDDGGSISLDENDNNFSASEDGSDDDDDMESEASGTDDESTHLSKKKTRKQSQMLDNKSFAKKLNNNRDISSLFAAADEFTELLEESKKVKGQGTTNAIFNKDKSSDKQLKWEEGRRSNGKNQMHDRKRKFSAGRSKHSGNKFTKKLKK